MSGVVVEIRIHDGHEVKKGDPIAVLSAMKMVCYYILFSITDMNVFANSHLGNGDLRPAQRKGVRPPGQGGRLRRWPGPDLQDQQGVKA
jgi:hypothetical protein